MINKDIKSNLKKIHKLLSNPKHWTQGAQARDKYGHVVNPTDPRAYKFCLLGASNKVSYNDFPLEKTLRETSYSLGLGYGYGIVSVNDDSGVSRKEAYKNVLKIVEQAIINCG